VEIDETSPTEPGLPPPRPRIVVNDDLLLVANESWRALKHSIDDDTNEPIALVLHGVLVRPADRGFEPYSKDSLLGAMTRSARFVTVRPSGDIAASPPLNVRSELLTRQDHQYGADAWRVRRFTTTPVFTSDHRLIQTPGLDAESQIFYRPAPELVDLRIPEDIDLGDVELAVDVISDAFAEIPFADDASRANAYALLLTPFIKEMVGKVPMTVIDAPAGGINTGKTLTGQIALFPALGGVTITNADRADGDEWRKVVTAAHLGGQQLLFIDNLSRVLDSGTIAAALTGDRWSDRILGHSQMIDVPNDLLWVLTGNGIQISQELARRAMPIRLMTPPDGRAWARSFSRRDIDGWLAHHRRELVFAALTLCQFWVRGGALGAAGDEEAGLSVGATVHSFVRWSQVVGGILKDAYVDGFMGNHAAFIEEMGSFDSDDDDEREELLRTWHTLDLGSLKPLDLVPLLKPLGALHQVRPVALSSARDDAQLKQAIGTWCGHNKNIPSGGYVLKRDGTKRWAVERIEP